MEKHNQEDNLLFQDKSLVHIKRGKLDSTNIIEIKLQDGSFLHISDDTNKVNGENKIHIVYEDKDGRIKEILEGTDFVMGEE